MLYTSQISQRTEWEKDQEDRKTRSCGLIEGDLNDGLINSDPLSTKGGLSSNSDELKSLFSE